MSFDWIEYFKLAKELAGESDDPPNEEAKLRSSISRAYFAAHGKTRKYLLQAKKYASIPEDISAHSFVINHFRGSADIVQRKFGSDLNHLHKLRKIADYDEVIENIKSTTQGAFGYAERIFRYLNSSSIS